MLENAAALIAEYGMCPRDGALLCAVSGGADSMCLLHYLWSGAEAGGYELHAAHFDHMLRGEESDRDAAFTADWCRAREIPFHLGRGDVAAEAARLGRGIEETARELRYAFLERTAREIGAERIATAHNADDNAETLLLHLVRGTGLRGLTGIPPRRGRLVRPLLSTPRTEIEAYLAAHGLPHVEDSTNGDPAYARNKIRSQVMPVLRELNPRLTESLTATVDTLRADNDYLTARAANAAGEARWADEDLVISARLVARQPDPVAVRMVRWMLERMGETQCGAAHLRAVVELARSPDPSASVDLPRGLVARRVYRELLLTAREEPRSLTPVPLGEGPVTVELGGWRVAFGPAAAPAEHPVDLNHVFLARTGPPEGLLLRSRRAGDQITLPRRGTKTLKKLFIDAKVPRVARDTTPVLADESGPLWVAGFGPEASRLAPPGEPAWELWAERLEPRVPRRGARKPETLP